MRKPQDQHLPKIDGPPDRPCPFARHYVHTRRCSEGGRLAQSLVPQNRPGTCGNQKPKSAHDRRVLRTVLARSPVTTLVRWLVLWGAVGSPVCTSLRTGRRRSKTIRPEATEERRVLRTALANWPLVHSNLRHYVSLTMHLCFTAARLPQRACPSRAMIPASRVCKPA